MKINKEFSAAGTKGCILIYPDISTGKSTGRKNSFGHDIIECEDTIISFRAYDYDENGHIKKDENGNVTFKDYKIRHMDLLVQLLDGHFYETDEGNFLDYPDMRYYKDDKASNSNPS